MQTTPEEVKTAEQKVEDARNVLTILEQDYLRIQKLHNSESYALGEINKAKVELEERNTQLTTANDNLKKENTDLTELKLEIERNIEIARNVLIKTNEEIQSNKDKDEERIKELDRRENVVTAREEAIEVREKAVAESETELNDKHEKIKEFKETIQCHKIQV